MGNPNKVVFAKKYAWLHTHICAKDSKQINLFWCRWGHIWCADRISHKYFAHSKTKKTTDRKNK